MPITDRRATLLTLALILSLLAVVKAKAETSPANSQARWLGPEGHPLPFETDEAVLNFLRTADVMSQKELTGGTNRPLKVRLRQDDIEANAIFRIVNVKRARAKLDGKIVPDFHDSYIYECAAWKVSRLLGIDHVPPCIERRFDLKEGSIQLWIEDAMTEKKRREDNIKPPEQLRWMRQKQTMRLFDALIYNFDRNQGNMLIDPRWKLWFIDHTRSFRKSRLIVDVEKIVWCEREVFERLQALNRKTLSRRLGSLITGVQINMMLKRRDALVDHLRTKIEEVGEGAVIWAADSPAEIPEDQLPNELDDDIPLTSSAVEDP